MSSMTSGDKQRKVAESPQGDSLLFTVLRYVLIAFLDVFALILVYALFRNEATGLAAVIAIATIGVNIISFVPRLYPLRWMAPGLFLITILVIFPVFYTISVSLTNFGDGHLFSKESSISLILENNLYVPDGAVEYRWQAYRDDNNPDNVALWLTRTDEDGNPVIAFAERDNPIEFLNAEDYPELPETYNGYTLVPRNETAFVVGAVDGVIFGEGLDTVRAQGLNARERLPRYIYDEEADLFVDDVTGLRFVDNPEQGIYEPETLAYRYDSDANTLTAEASGIVYTPNDDGYFEIYDSVYEYRALQGGTLVDRNTSNLASARADENGIFYIKHGQPLNPGYLVDVGLYNFTRFFSDPGLRGPLITIFIWTIMFAFFSVATTFAMGLFMALVLNDARIPGKKFIRSLLILPYAIPGVIGIVVWRGLLNPEFGFINDIFGLDVRWFSYPEAAKIAVILVNLWLGYPYMMLICSGALQAIPSDIYEAAAVDGATPFDRFWKITLPLLLVTVGPLLIASFVYNFNNYLMIEALTRGDPQIPGSPTPAGYTDILISYTYNLAFGNDRGADYGYASAITIVIFFLVSAVTMVQYRFTKGWEEVGENV